MNLIIDPHRFMYLRQAAIELEGEEFADRLAEVCKVADLTQGKHGPIHPDWTLVDVRNAVRQTITDLDL